MTVSLELEAALIAPVQPLHKLTARAAASSQRPATSAVANGYAVAFDVDNDGKQYPEFENPNWRETADIILEAQPWRGKHVVRLGRGGIVLP